LTFAVAGRARFLSHLETVDTLLGALRRAGYDIALLEGVQSGVVVGDDLAVDLEQQAV